MSATLVSRPVEVLAFDNGNRAPSARRDKLNHAIGTGLLALEAALKQEGVINEYAGDNGYTPVHRRLEEFETANIRLVIHLENTIERLSKQLENVLANDAFTDPEARAAVLQTVNRKRTQPLADKATYSPAEQELVAWARQMSPEDREVLRVIMRRLGADKSTSGEDGSGGKGHE